MRERERDDAKKQTKQKILQKKERKKVSSDFSRAWYIMAVLRVRRFITDSTLCVCCNHIAFWIRHYVKSARTQLRGSGSLFIPTCTCCIRHCSQLVSVKCAVW